MGHLEPSELAGGPRWRQVVKLLEAGSPIDELVNATVLAAEHELDASDHDPAFVYTVWLLTQLPLAANSKNFEGRLAEFGFPIESAHSLHGLVAAFSDAVNAHVMRSSNRTDLGELARLAASESLSTVIGAALPSLFDASAADLKAELARHQTKSKFARLARDFFARLTQKTLEYYLSREFPNHVGPNKAYQSIADQIAFRQALDDHCYAAAAIVEKFAAGWYGKANYRGEITPDHARNFASYALTKMRRELRRRRVSDG
jgi:hypothetical protein